MMNVNQQPLNLETVQQYFMKYMNSSKRQTEIKLYNAYLGKYDIDNVVKPKGKPNNKLTNNYAKYIVDTFCGFFDGNPLVVKSVNEAVQDCVNKFNDDNTTADLDYELIKHAAIFGHCYELIYQDESATTKSAIVSPLNGFVVYDNTIAQNPWFALRFVQDEDNGDLFGEVYTANEVYSIKGNGLGINSMEFVGVNQYHQVNMIEYVFNKERQGIFENQLSLINSYNKVESEKANDVEYFSDAILAIIGSDLPSFEVEERKVINGKEQVVKRPATMQEKLERFTSNFRNSKVIFAQSERRGAQAPERPEIKYLAKPEADTTQEHLLSSLEKDIFHFSMVANISDENFGNASGVALRYKLLSMRNLAKTVERNITRSLKKRYELVFSFSTNISESLKDEWKSLRFEFSENLPQDISTEADAVNKLLASGVISKETALSLLSFVDNPQEELERVEKEDEEEEERAAKRGPQLNF